MRAFHTMTPEGARDLVFEPCRLRRQLEARLENLFTTWGYQEVITPGLEFYDVFSGRGQNFPQELMYKTTDHKGRLLVVRPDATLPIARLAATRLKQHPRPLRFFYNTDVYRMNPELTGRNHQIRQMGVEQIGSAQADGEMLRLAGGVLEACQATGFRIEIGHAGMFSWLVGALGLSAAQQKAMARLIEAKNEAGLESELEGLEDSPEKALLRRLPRLFGGIEVLDEALVICNAPALLDIAKDVRMACSALTLAGLDGKVIIDLGQINRLEYYTGLLFSGYVSDWGSPVLSGGRYDTLLSMYGESEPAIGFGVDVDALSSALSQAKASKADGARPLRLALTKGRLEEKTLELMEKAGYDVSAVRSKGRKLVLEVPGAGLQIVLAKAADVITYVERGVCDMGVVGKDTILENRSRFYEWMDLGFGKCRFAVAAPKDAKVFEGTDVKTIATKYPAVARAFFEEKGMDVDIVKIEGSVELAPLLGLADAIVDIVETGSTLRENGLEVMEDIADISARLIVNVAGMKLRRQEIEGFGKRLEGAIRQKREEKA